MLSPRSSIYEKSTQSSALLSCGFYNLVEENGPRPIVAIRTALPSTTKASAICRRTLGIILMKYVGDLAFVDVADRGVLLPPFRFVNNQMIYSGEWRNCRPHGRGEIFFPNEDFFEGSFYDGIPFGAGRLIERNGSYYQGSIIKGICQGKGTVYDAHTQLKYQGDFQNGKPHGIGTETMKTQAKPTFVGQFRDGHRVRGRYCWGQNGQFMYEGAFVEGLFEGFGTVTSHTGLFRGRFVKGQKEGEGHMTWNDKRQYKGNYSKNVKSGYGQLYNSDGTLSYKGWWLGDLPNGQGIGYQNGFGVRGIWVNGIIEQPTLISQS